MWFRWEWGGNGVEYVGEGGEGGKGKGGRGEGGKGGEVGIWRKGKMRK